MIRALVMTHGNIGAELVRVVELILGPVEGLTAMSNTGKSLPDIGDAVVGWLTGDDSVTDGDGAIVLVDDYGGSCSTAAQLAIAEAPHRAVLSGVNLAMLLGFATWRDSDDFEELVERLVRKGREAITHVRAR